MLTYDLTTIKKGELYEALYKMIRDDIKRGTLTAGEKLPSKRALAKNLASAPSPSKAPTPQLISEGYVYSLPKRGYYIAKLEAPRAPYSCGKKRAHHLAAATPALPL